jgi:hypothetical protein
MLVAGVALVVCGVALAVYFIVSADPTKWRNAGAVGMLTMLLFSLGTGMVVTARKIMNGDDPGNRIF